MKLLEVMDVMNIKQHEEVWSVGFLTKKSRSGINVNEQIAQELHKTVIKNFQRRKIYARFKCDIWAADLAETKSLSSNNRSVKYLLCVIDVFTKYV